MEDKNIHSLFEDCRSLLMNTEPVSKKIESITNPQLQEKLLEIFRTVQSDLLIMTDFLFEVMNCQTECDLEILFSLYSDTDEVKA